MRKYLLFALLLIIIVLTTAVGWVVGTTDGLRWAIQALSRNSGVAISAGSVEGRLIDRATLKQVTITLPQKNIQLDSLSLDWKPSALLAGTIGIRELVIGNLRIQDDTPEKERKEPPDLVWPRPPKFLGLFDLNISRLLLDKLSYRQLENRPVVISDIQARLAWLEQKLSLENLTATTSDGRLAGKIAITFSRPSLASDLEFISSQPIAEMRIFRIQTELLHGKGKEQVAGRFSLSGSKNRDKAPPPLRLEGVAGITRNSINLRDFSLTIPEVPGRISGDGTLTLTAADPLLALQLNLSRINLAKFLKNPTDLEGNLKLSGTVEKYSGNFDLANRGDSLRTGRLAGGFQGTKTSINIGSLNGKALGGDVSGRVEANWSEGIRIAGLIRGRNFDPGIISPQWKGVINLDLTGDLSSSEKKEIKGRIKAVLLDSRLHGQKLSGQADGRIQDNNLLLERLFLQGKGFDLRASGDLKRKLDFTAKISDLSRLIPETGGAVSATGWFKLRDGLPSGALAATGKALSQDKLKISGLKLDILLGEGKNYPLRLNSNLRGVSYGKLQADTASINATGTALSHDLRLGLKSTDAEVQMAISGEYVEKQWNAVIKSASGRDSAGPWSLKNPATLNLTRNSINLSPALITTPAGERLELTLKDVKFKPLTGRIMAGWTDFNLSRANPWLNELKLSGRSSGAVTAELNQARPVYSGRMTTVGSITTKEGRITVEGSTLRFENDKDGVSADLDLRLKDGGQLKGSFASPFAAGSTIPEQGDFKFEVKELNTAVIAPWLRGATNLEGVISMTGSGRLMPGKRFEVNGSSTLVGGRFRSVKKEGVMDINLRSAVANWNWRGEAVEGKIFLALSEYGDAKGSFKLPIPARFPVAVKPDGPLQGELTGKVREKGLLTGLFPELVQESRGDLDLDVRVGGIWKEPVLTGKIALTKAGGYIPRAGIRLKDVTLTAILNKNLIKIETFRANSGAGYLDGKAELQLKGGKLAAYSGNINGRDFQTVSFPELQVVSTPQLAFAGTREKLTVRGEVKLPQLHVNGKQQTGAVTPSSDVIVEGRSRPAGRQAPLDLDIQVRLLLGDSVLVKAQGIDAQLGGQMELQVQALDKIKSKGEIKVVKGRYKTYGINLDIVRGNLFYAGGYINQPTLDILALRTAGEVKAGVTVGGTLQAPLVKLYSEPAMPDVDILAYIVLGHPLGGGTEQAGLLAQAAGVLLSAGQSASLQEQLKSRLGLSTLELQSGSAKSAYMGYKPIQPTTKNGKTAAPQQDGISQTILTVGKYLTPQLYISYGRSLFTGENRFLLRYDIYKNWQIETQTGTESGADLYYKIEFN